MAVIGFLRFIGIMNAAVWLGTAIFFTFGAEPACLSADMKNALGIGAGESYFPGAIEMVVMSRYYHVALACGVVALLHLLLEWLYMGRPHRKFAFGLIAGMFLLTFFASNAIQPKLAELNKQRYRAQAQADRDRAARSFHILNVTRHVFQALIIGGLVVYVWRVANPSDTLRFLGPVKLRS